MNRHVQGFLIAAAVLTIGGAVGYRYYYDYFLLMPSVSMQEVELREHLIMSIAIGFGLFICMSGGFLLFRAVRQSRIGTFAGLTLFALLVVVSAIVPLLSMLVSQLVWGDVYRGEHGWDFLIAICLIIPFLVGFAVIFVVSVLISHHRHAKARA